MLPAEPVAPRSLTWATEIDVLPPNRSIERRERYWVVRSPSNAGHWWGNFLLLDQPPAPGDGDAWEALFEAEFTGLGSRHRAMAWDTVAGETGAAEAEFGGRGYRIERTCGLIATASEIVAHPRASRDVEIRQLRSEAGADADLWEQVIELQVAGRDASLESEEGFRVFSRARQQGLRTIFLAGRGSWWVAVENGREVVGSCGLVVTGTRARYQTVDTAIAHRSRGICSRLLVEAAQRTAATNPVERFVIAADPGYHALGIYESLGFRRAELVCGALRPSPFTA